MIGLLVGVAILTAASGQDAAKAPWRTDVQAARDEALRDRRPCVILLYLDSK